MKITSLCCNGDLFRQPQRRIDCKLTIQESYVFPLSTERDGFFIYRSNYSNILYYKSFPYSVF